MAGVKAGGDRQQLHERIRLHSIAAVQAIKAGQPNDLLTRISTDPAFGAVQGEIAGLIAPTRFAGRAPEQVDDYLAGTIYPLLQQGEDLEPVDAEVQV
jgi:adenylosuccinate lyase